MAEFSHRSKYILSTCHMDLQVICNKAIKIYDFSVITGYRGELQQGELFTMGKTRLQYPNSLHNQKPSIAVDLAPYPVDWNNHKRFYLLAGIMFAIADSMKIKIRWGGDWKMNWSHSQNFIDLPHFELKNTYM